MADTLKFTRDHLWLRIEGSHAHVGISEHAQAELGEIIAAELPDVGDSVEKGQSFGELESVKTVNDLIAPVSGQVVAINTELDDHPNIVNEDPYHEGWLIEVELADQAELDVLLDADEYDALISGEDEA
jgi:glycine cleavage system H protein